MCLYHSCKCLTSFYAVSSVCLSTAVNVLCVLSSDRRGIEWISLSGFISFATSTPNNLGLVRNELQLVDLPTGWCFLGHLYKRLSDLLRSRK